MTQRNLVSSQMMQANVQNAWSDNSYRITANTIQNLGKDISDYNKQNEAIAFQRLDLEAQKLQNEQLEQIKIADSQEKITQIEADFNKNLHETFGKNKWGKKWLEARGQNFIAANSIDVQKLSTIKKEEFTLLETDKTLNAYADEISLSNPDKANALVNQAHLMIDNLSLTPTKKHDLKTGFTKKWVSAMVDNNTDMAINLLSDNGKLSDISQIERQDYLQKANTLKIAKQKEALSLKNLEEKQNKLTNDRKISELKVGLLTSKYTIKDIEQAKIDGVFDLSPKEYYNSYAIISKKGEDKNKNISNPEVLKTLKQGIIDNVIGEDDIVNARLKDEISASDAKEFLSLLKTKNENKKDSSDNLRNIINLIGNGKIQSFNDLTTYYTNNDIDYETFNKAWSYLKETNNNAANKKKELETLNEEESFKAITKMIDNNEITSVDEINDLYQNSKIARKTWNDAVSYMEKRDEKVKSRKKELETLNEEESFKAITEMIDKNEITSVDEINDLYQNSKITHKTWNDAVSYMEKIKAKEKSDKLELDKLSDQAALKSIVKMIDDGVISDIGQLNDLYYGDKPSISKDVWEKAVSYYDKQEANIKAKKANKDKEIYMANYLDDLSKIDDLSITRQEIIKNIKDKKYSQADGEKLIEALNKKMASVGKIKPGDKAYMAISLYADLEKLYGGDAKIEDFNDFNDKIVEYMNLEIIDRKDGEQLLNTFSMSYMAKYQEDLQKYGSEPFIGKNEGFFAIKDWIEDTLGKEPEKPKANDSLAKFEDYYQKMGNRALAIIDMYKLYADALEKTAREQGLDSVAQILQQDKTTQSTIYGAAVQLTQNSWAKNRYKSINLLKTNPTAILSKQDGLVNIGGANIGGTKLEEQRIVAVAKDSTGSKYAIRYVNGEIKEVDYQTYKMYGGK